MKLDGFLARKYNLSSVLGTILDPAADKALMTTLTVTLTMQELIPRKSVQLLIIRFQLFTLGIRLYPSQYAIPTPTLLITNI
jgi:cardiolipin synthase (CMP-forming)